jgi:acyl-CoA synthetase (AMP-forming)/AMP-acid ligase II
MSAAFPTLVHLLRHRAAEPQPRGAYRFLAPGVEDVVMSYRELDERARALAVRLAERGGKGERALILTQPGLEYLVAYFGSLYAGWIPVPAYPPNPNPKTLDRDLPRLQGIIRDCTPAAIVTTRLIAAMAGLMPPVQAVFASAALVVTDEAGGSEAAAWKDPGVGPADIGLLQYTSGSVGDPKGVMVSHANLMVNTDLCRRVGLEPGFGVVSWLPQYHDMGLIGAMLAPMLTDMNVYFMSPLDFLVKPIRWLQAISRFRAEITVAPNFAFALTARKAKEEEVDQLDLSPLELVYNGAEPIRADVLDAFARRFAACGFRHRAFVCCYGLAEATLIVTGAHKSAETVVRRYSKAGLGRGEATDPTSDGDAATLVGCGPVPPETRIRIVEPESMQALPERRVGEIWLQGATIGQGYWNQPETTREYFEAQIAGAEAEGGWMRTGDLGFLDGAELFLAGRLKDLIIVRGVNHYPQDIELSAEEAHSAVRRGCVVAVQLPEEEGAGLAIIAEVERRVAERRQEQEATPPGRENRTEQRRSSDELELMGAAAPEIEFSMSGVIEKIIAQVARRHDVRPDWIILVPAATIPKTPSGKLKRQATRELLLSEKLPVIAERRAGE